MNPINGYVHQIFKHSRVMYLGCYFSLVSFVYDES